MICPRHTHWWPSEELAEHALARILNRARGPRRMERRAYQCGDCGHWVLTSMTEEEFARPSQAELWRRQQLAVSLLNQRGPTADAAALVLRVLNGELIQDLVKEVS